MLPGVQLWTYKTPDLRTQETTHNYALPGGIPGIPAHCWHYMPISFYDVTRGIRTWSKGYSLGPAVGLFPGFPETN